MQNVENNTDLQGNNISDNLLIDIINEFAKVDNKALKLMIQLQDAKEYGEKDMIVSQIYHYIKGKVCV